MAAEIELYYWPTPSGWKISIALEEMRLPYRTHLVDISAGDQFKPEFLKISPQQPDACDHRPRGAGWRADRAF